MPSRKKSQGRARKAAAKSRKESVKSKDNGLCRHGLPTDLNKECLEFIDSFNNELYRSCDQELTPLRAVMQALDVTREKNREVSTFIC